MSKHLERDTQERIEVVIFWMSGGNDVGRPTDLSTVNVAEAELEAIKEWITVVFCRKLA